MPAGQSPDLSARIRPGGKALKEHDRVVLTADLLEEGLRTGDVGVIVHVYPQGKAFEVEFFGLDGHTIAVAPAEASQVRPATARDIPHTRLAGTPAQAAPWAEKCRGLSRPIR